ncbi:hypothetical protein [Phyllobacterium leguminum]|uniref:Uncharacterized protein n=1 Tax=Phyllobacterium leguminum TaxID=314237 RepID=A0A318SZW1_9HYPH|nr:hypothetical protein [Phyllobacterium leguminum]PYE87505.1 hypothetical protein C7477_1126 [Phyllobacterium leguminum]
MAKQPQNRKSYRYTGPVTPLDIEGEPTRMLFPGTSYTGLPEDHVIVSNLIDRKLLVAEYGETAAIAADIPVEGA